MKGLVYLVAGGTGGHINAALSMGEILQSSYSVKYVSGTRFLDYKLFSDKDVLHLDSKPIRTKNPFVIVKNILKNIYVFIGFFFKLLVNRPKFLIGAGGYICGPTLLAAYTQRIPVFIIEQNAVMGVTNKILSNISKRIFVNFEDTKGLENNKRVRVSGNPIRSSIEFKKQQLDESNLNILVFGGSLGAAQINEAIYALLKKSLSKKISIKHQVGKGNLNNEVRSIESIKYSQSEYIEDMNEAFKWANIIISRAGASSVTELSVVGKPCLLIPYPAATDNHQFFNAIGLKKTAKFYVEVIDNKLKGDELAEVIKAHLEVLFNNEEKLLAKKIDSNKNASQIIKEEIEKCLA